VRKRNAGFVTTRLLRPLCLSRWNNQDFCFAIPDHASRKSWAVLRERQAGSTLLRGHHHLRRLPVSRRSFKSVADGSQKWARVAELEMEVDGKKIGQYRATTKIYFDIEY